MIGAIPPLPDMPSWSGAQLKHRDNCTFLIRSNDWSHNRSSLVEAKKYFPPPLNTVSTDISISPATNYGLEERG
jgi:hypothetical protein